MKIAVTGAHRVGKTTLVELLQELLPEYLCKQEAYHDLEERGLLFSEIPDPEDYLMQLEHSIEQMSSCGNNVIFDRCPIDMLAYIQVTQELKNNKIQNIQYLFRRVEHKLLNLF